MPDTPARDVVERCAKCGLPITMQDASYYERGAQEDIGRVYHAACGDPFALAAGIDRHVAAKTAALEAEISRLTSELAEAREALDAPSPSSRRQHRIKRGK